MFIVDIIPFSMKTWVTQRKVEKITLKTNQPDKSHLAFDLKKLLIRASYKNSQLFLINKKVCDCVYKIYIY